MKKEIIKKQPRSYAKKHSSRLVISFSGGRSSAVMLDQVLSKWGSSREITIIFANTGKEEAATLQFVDDVDRNFCRTRGHKVVWIEAIINNPGKGPTAKEVTFETSNRDGKVFEAAIAKHGIFNKSYPNCTGRLKVDPMHWWIKHHKGWENGTYETAIGIRSDEMDRVSPRHSEKRWVYPLVTWGWTKKDVSNYMSKFVWDLKIPGDHWGNCDVCWKKSLRKLMTRAQENPSVYDWWNSMELKYGMKSNGKVQVIPRVFFRNNKSSQDIINLSRTTDFKSYEDDVYDSPEFSNPKLDTGSSCGESCEIGSDDADP